MLSGGSIIAVLYLGFMAVIFSLMTVAQRADDAMDAIDASLPTDTDATPRPIIRVLPILTAT